MATVSLGVSTASSSNAGSYAAGAFTPAAGDVLVLLVSATGTVASTILGGTVSDTQNLGWNQLTYSAYNGTTDTIAAFVSVGTAAASSITVTWSCSGDNATGASLTVYRFAGVVSGGYVRQVGISTGSANSNAIITMQTAILTGNPCAAMVTNATINNSGLSNPVSWTGDTEVSYTSPVSNHRPIRANSGITTSTVNFAGGGQSTTAWGGIAVELYNSGTGPQPDDGMTGYYGGMSAP